MRQDHNWVQTFTGRQFWPTDPSPEDINIRDIAHALSLKCRFSGHCLQFYSIAQHSSLTSMFVSRENKLCALLHDASEAYLADVARPVKRELLDFQMVEHNLERCIAERFGLPWPMPEEVKMIDNRLLRTEKEDLMRPSITWGCLEGIERLPIVIVPISCQDAEAEFLHQFECLWDII